MARPKSTGLSYFPHDCDACTDEKIEAMRILHGNDGYAFYFILLERIYRTADSELPISDAETIQILSKKLDVTSEKFNSMLQTALKKRLFEPEAYTERAILTSPGIRKRTLAVTNKREKMAESYQKGVSAAEIPPETPQSKVNKTKEIDIGKQAALPPSPPSIEEQAEGFRASLQPFETTYSQEMINAFFDYWREPNKSRTRMRWQQEKTWDLNLRLQRWAKNEKPTFKNATATPQIQPDAYQKARQRTAQLAGEC